MAKREVNEQNSKKILLTRESINELKAELKHLIEVVRPEIIEEIKDARAQGDLSENAEYDAAREKQGQVEDRILELEAMLENVEELKHHRKDIISIGTTVKIKMVTTGTEQTYNIVSTFEADPFENKISNQSPLAQAIMGKSKGDVVLVDAPQKYEVEIVEIS